MLQSSSRNHKLNSQNGMARTVATPARAAAKETTIKRACIDLSSRFFENQPNEICSHLSVKASKGRFLNPEKFQNHSNEGKGDEKNKERGEEKIAMVAILGFMIATLEIVFGRKKLLDGTTTRTRTTTTT